MATTIQVRVDEQLKSDVEKILDELGLDISTAVRMFFAKIRRVQGLPFEARLYNEETIQAIEDAMAGRNLIGPFDTADKMFASLESEDEKDKPVYVSKPKRPMMVAEDEDAEYNV
jgi:DNA-damage-inducible protein J